MTPCEHGEVWPHVLEGRGIICVPGLREAFWSEQDDTHNLRARYDWLCKNRGVGQLAFCDKLFADLTERERERLMDWPK